MKFKVSEQVYGKLQRLTMVYIIILSSQIDGILYKYIYLTTECQIS
jgi:hypothetical protein